MGTICAYNKKASSWSSWLHGEKTCATLNELLPRNDEMLNGVGVILDKQSLLGYLK